MGLSNSKQSKNNSETINWDNIKTQDMSSDVFNFKGGHNISNDVKMLISKLDLNNDSEFNFNNIFTNNNTHTEHKINNDNIDSEMNGGSPFITSDMYNYLITKHNNKNNMTGGADMEKSSDTSSTSSTDSDSKNDSESDSESESETEKKPKSKKNKKPSKSSDTNAETDAEMIIQSVPKSKGGKNNRKNTKKNNKKNNKTSENSYKGTDYLSYISSSEHNNNNSVSIRNENNYSISSINTSNINMISDN